MEECPGCSEGHTPRTAPTPEGSIGRKMGHFPPLPTSLYKGGGKRKCRSVLIGWRLASPIGNRVKLGEDSGGPGDRLVNVSRGPQLLEGENLQPGVMDETVEFDSDLLSRKFAELLQSGCQSQGEGIGVLRLFPESHPVFVIHTFILTQVRFVAHPDCRVSWRVGPSPWLNMNHLEELCLDLFRQIGNGHPDPYDLGRAHLYAVSPFGNPRLVLQTVDVYAGVAAIPCMHDAIGDSPYLALETCGWAAPIHDDDVAPSVHPHRRRVRLLIVVNRQGDAASTVGFKDDPDKPLTTMEGRGLLSDSLADSMRRLELIQSLPLNDLDQ